MLYKLLLIVFFSSFSCATEDEETLDNFRFPINLSNMRDPVEQDPDIIRERFCSYVRVYASHIESLGFYDAALYSKITAELFPKDLKSIERLGPFEDIEVFSSRIFDHFGVNKIRGFFFYQYTH